MAKYQFRVEVVPRYLPDQSAPAQGHYVFAYTITITNTGEVAAQVGLWLPFFKQLKVYVEALGRHVCAAVLPGAVT